MLAKTYSRLVDLSLPIYHDMPIWSSEPKIGVLDYFKIGRQAGDREIMNMKLLLMCGHAGTHVDVPYHLRPEGQNLDQVPLERFIGPALVIDLSHKGAGDAIDVPDLAPYEGRIRPGARLLLRTGWDRHLGTPLYFDKEAIPKLTPQLMRWLNERRVWLVGVDTPSVNPYLDRHVVLFESADPPVVVELMTNLDQLPAGQEVFLICLPLRIREGDGSPVRAIALIGE
jgi:kynurenine formamidase